MRNPNGYGSVVKLSGNRRRPFVARKTIDWNEKGHPKYGIIGCFATKEEALIALAGYNNEPWDLDKAKITFEELFKLWKEKKSTKLSKSNKLVLSSAYHHCKIIHAKKYKEIKAYHMQECVDNCGKSYATQGTIKNLFYHLDRFALELDIATRCYSELVTIAPTPPSNKTPFTNDEIDKIWGMADTPWVDSVIVLLYTGFRISELLGLYVSSVDVERGTVQGGVKTKAGKDRIVPIHRKILPLVRNRISEGGEYLFGNEGKKTPVRTYYAHWERIMNSLGLKHTPHECRHTFRSRLDSAGANKKCIDLLMGHASKDIGERVYTHKAVDELKEAIELLD